jgi:hypothetical protein
MRLLVTRAAREAGETARILRERGHEVLVSPVLEMRAAGAFVAVGIAAALVNLHASSTYWFHLLPSGEAVRRVYFSSIGRQGNSSLFAFAARAPFVHHVSATVLAYLLAILVGAIGLVSAWWAQTQGLRVTAVAVVGLTTATVSPVSWDHHWIWAILLPILATLGLGFAGVSFLIGSANARSHLWLSIIGAIIGFGASSIMGFIRQIVS